MTSAKVTQAAPEGTGHLALLPVLLAPILLLLFFSVQAVEQVVREHRRIATFEPVEAEIISARVGGEAPLTRQRFLDSTKTWAEISYRYLRSDRVHSSTSVLVLPEFAREDLDDRAEQIVSAFPAGSTRTAYVDPADPSDSFLVREHELGPHQRALFLPLFVGLGLALTLGALARSWPGSPRHPKRLLGGFTIVWYAWGGTVLGHHLYVGAHGRGWMIASAGIFFAIGVGLILLTRALRPAQEGEREGEE